MRIAPTTGALACALLATSTALGFSYQTPASDGCHELVTSDALRAVRKEGRAPPLPFDRNERALANDLPFTVADELDDLAAVALLIGVRDNDLRGRSPTDLEHLANLHGDDAVQREHCLRAAGQDGHAGTIAAVADCRAFIRGKFLEAIDAAPGARTELAVVLPIRGKVTVSLPTFHVRLGEALHALQDSFTHTFRTADGTEVTVVLNWVEHVRREHDEARDGPPHMSPLDRCDDKAPINTSRRQWATAASIELMRAATAPGDRTAKLAAFDHTLDSWLGIRAGCTESNNWCDAPELALAESGCSCRQAGGKATNVGLVLVGVAIAAMRRKKLAALALLLLPSTARAADEEHAPAFQPCVDPKHPATGAPGEEGAVSRGTKDLLGEPSRNFGVHGGIGASFDSPAFVGALGARYRITDLWLIGLGAEWNPWGSPFHTIHTGAFNAYATGIRRWQLRSDTYALRTSLHLGTSTLLFDVYGAPRGTTGFFAGVSVVGIEVKLGSGMTMIFEPADFALPVPQLRGYFGYPQYRFTIGLQWGAAGR